MYNRCQIPFARGIWWVVIPAPDNSYNPHCSNYSLCTAVTSQAQRSGTRTTNSALYDEDAYIEQVNWPFSKGLQAGVPKRVDSRGMRAQQAVYICMDTQAQHTQVADVPAYCGQGKDSTLRPEIRVAHPGIIRQVVKTLTSSDLQKCAIRDRSLE